MMSKESATLVSLYSRANSSMLFCMFLVLNDLADKQVTIVVFADVQIEFVMLTNDTNIAVINC